MGRPKLYTFSSDEDIPMCIYKITHKANGKVYIGKTIRNAYWRWVEHKHAKSNTIIGRSIRKNGIAAFTFEVIDVAETEESLSQKEAFYISYYNSLAPQGMNLTGGDGGKCSPVLLAQMQEIVVKSPNYVKSRRLILAQRTEEERLRDKKRLAEEASKRQTGVPVLKNRRPVIRSDGVVFDGIISAAKNIQCKESSITRVLRNTTHKTIKGYSFLRLDKHSEEYVESWVRSFNKEN